MKIDSITSMDQVWPHLKHLDARFDAVANYLNGRVGDNDTIIDLNCGDSRILSRLKSGKYIGTDAVRTEEGQAYRKQYNGEFLHLKDDELNLSGHVDVVMLWGHGGYEISKEEVESPTVTDSLKKIIIENQPKYIVLESIQDYATILVDIINWCGSRYEIIIDEKLFLGKTREWNRQVYLLEKI